jgi:filamentous hemagglutinin
VSNPIVEALQRAAQRVGTALGDKAGKAVEDLYRDTSGRVKAAVQRTLDADAESAAEIRKIADQMEHNASRTVSTQTERRGQADTQAALRKRLTAILDPGADPNTGIHGPGRDDPALPEARLQAKRRSSRLQAALPEASRGRVTMGVSVGRDEAGALRTVVSTSERRGYLRPGVTLEDGEELATGDGHAEPSGIAYMHEHGITPITVGAGRPICENCARSIRDAAAAPATELKGAPGRRPS